MFSLLQLVASFAILILAVLGSPGGPQAQCGWPYMSQGGIDYKPATTEIAQYLLGHALNVNVTGNGKYDDAMVALVKIFQRRAQLQQDGVLGPDTWKTLVDYASPLSKGSSGQAVLALQQALRFNNINVSLTGSYDAATVAAMQKFEQTHQVPNSTATVCTAYSWHILIASCNASQGVFWFDFGWPEGSGSVEQFQCLRSNGFHFGTFECWIEGEGSEYPNGRFWSPCVQNIANAWAAGLDSVGVYLFPQRYGNATVQVLELIGNLTANSVPYSAVMLDIEGSKWSEYTQDENQRFIMDLYNTLQANGVHVTVYCGYTSWVSFFGASFTSLSHLPLIYAHYDNVPSFYDFYPTFGGWTKPAGKQFWDGSQGELVCGCCNGGLDWDWSEDPFWA